MRWVFAVSLGLGLLALIAYLILPGTRDQGSDGRSGSRVPQLLAAAVAFGMGGLSGSYAGWDLWIATLAAVAAAGLAAWYARTANRSGNQDSD